MSDLRWYLNRLRAMNAGEIIWRIDQKRIGVSEKKRFKNNNIRITEKVFHEKWEGLAFHKEKLGLPELTGEKRQDLISVSSIPIPGDFSYEKYKKDWHAGYQTENKWPVIYSPELEYRQRDEIGDARTNWELNRHFQFALLAKNYYLTSNTKYFEELEELFEDWNSKNPFLMGISWTSAMEMAIRSVNWIYTIGFLSAVSRRDKSEPEEKILKEICYRVSTGIINITDYLTNHYSRYSSANNHVIVEACAIGIAGIVFDNDNWFKTAEGILDREIPRQNYEDGVNKEVSLHYQAFFMEAVGLLMLIMKNNSRKIPGEWLTILMKMSRYVSDCRGIYKETVVFGDDDDGKILELEGIREEKRDYYDYVIQLMGIVLPERYTEEVSDKTLLCIVRERWVKEAGKKPFYCNSESACYEKGGVSLFKSRDGSLLAGMDHGELGFGSIAAHGHADALSFQMFLDGIAVFADAGTYIYHVNLSERNAFRKTENHNTIEIHDKDQSEMLGAFLWGKRAMVHLSKHNLRTGGMVPKENTKELSQKRETDPQYVSAYHDGYGPLIHRRTIAWNGSDRLTITDRLERVQKETPWKLHYLLGSLVNVQEEDILGQGNLLDTRWKLEAGDFKITVCIQAEEAAGNPFFQANTQTENVFVSPAYGKKKRTKKLTVSGCCQNDMEIITMIEWEKK